MDSQEIMEALDLVNKLTTYKHYNVSQNAERLQEILLPVLSSMRDREIRREQFSDAPNGETYGGYYPVKEAQKAFTALHQATIFFSQSGDDIKRYQEQTQDLLHGLELLDASEEELMGYATELKDVRQARRRVKDFQEQVRPLRDWSVKNRTAVNQLKSIVGEITKIQDGQKERSYTPRAETSVGEAFKQALVAKKGEESDEEGHGE